MTKRLSNKGFDVQVDRKHYYIEEYDTLETFIRYFYQIDQTRKLNPKNILEIGIGNKTVSNYFKQHGMEVTTCDFDKNLEPDYIADIRELPFEDNSFDVVLASEILEHLPWESVDSALAELRRVSKKYVIISIPHATCFFEFVIKFSLIKKILKKNFLRFIVGMPLFFSKINFLNGEHYWEIGRKNYSVKKVKNALKKHFRIIKEFRPVLTFNKFFVLEKIRKM